MLPMVLLAVICALLPADLAVSIFISEPANVTVFEGESVALNCTSHNMSNSIPLWIINGVQYYWSDFKRIDQYTFIVTNNSLTIHNVPRTLDGTSYQCAFNQIASQVGFLTVLYELTSTQVSTIQSETLTNDVQPLTSESSTRGSRTTTIVASKIHVIAAASVGGVLFIITTCCCVVLIVTCTLRKAKSNPPPQAIVEQFHMVKNDVYETKADIRITRNSAYCYSCPSHFVHAP